MHTKKDMAAGALNKEKYTNALLFFISECGNDHLGIMKLNKLFYYLDFISYRDRKISVTGETYVRFPKGPFAESLENEVLAPAEKNNLIERKRDPSEKFGVRNRFIAVSHYDLSIFDEYEQNLLKRIAENFCDWSTDQMVAQTHMEAPWVFSEDKEALDYDHASDIEVLKNIT
jgi:uncharacterized phage-associated protein